MLRPGISGGERKRLNIATEILGDPSLIFVDEFSTGKDPRRRIGVGGPFRVSHGRTLLHTHVYLCGPTLPGLDAVMAETVGYVLRSLSLSPGGVRRTVIASVHAPSSALYSLFTHVLVLSHAGRLAYFGPTKQLVSFLGGLGFHCPVNFNVADFVLSLVSLKVRGVLLCCLLWDVIPAA